MTNAGKAGKAGKAGQLRVMTGGAGAPKDTGEDEEEDEDDEEGGDTFRPVAPSLAPSLFIPDSALDDVGDPNNGDDCDDDGDDGSFRGRGRYVPQFICTRVEYLYHWYSCIGIINIHISLFFRWCARVCSRVFSF